MGIQTWFNLIYKIRNTGIGKILYFKNVQLKKKSREALLANKEFKNKHLGERCFILGNGPSLKQENLDLLRGEVVFTVNQFNRIPNYDKIQSSYHFWVDSNFFRIDTNNEADRELLNVMGSIGKETPISFFPLHQKAFCEKHGLDKKLNIKYFAAKPRLTFYEGFDDSMDFTKYLPGYGTVVQYCVSMAIYMGFSEIYLLGCDNTGIMVTLKSALHTNNDDDYAYKVTENEKKRMENLLNRSSIEQYAIDYAQTLTAYRRLYQYCRKRNIKLMNCSSSTVIDSIPRKCLEDVLSDRGIENDSKG